MKTLSFSILLLLSLSVGCSSSDGTAGAGGDAGTGGMGGDAGTGGDAGAGGMGGTGGVPSGPPKFLSEWGLFESIPDQVPVDGVLPYEVTSPLFTDYAAKFRFVQLPEGEQIHYSDTERWTNPPGTIYIKTFAYPYDELDLTQGYQLIETRLLVFNEDGADTWTYVYPEGDNSDAERISWGPKIDVSYKNGLGEDVSFLYEVPSVPQCKECHGIDTADSSTRSLGPSSGMLNRDNDYGGSVGVMNQINYMNSLGMFDIEPPPEGKRTTYVTDPAAPVVEPEEPGLHNRARSYFDSNCSQCHAPPPYGEISDKGLFLDYQSMDPDTGTSPFTWGVCKPPTSAGNGLKCDQPIDVVPGNPDASLLLCRMESIAAGERMPPLGRTLVHGEGVELIRAWIEELPNLNVGVTAGCPQR
jgi:uncharacterized repeat protein (TIGR03806 family)